jgi:hypothetical protein
MDVHAPSRNETPINAIRMSPPHVFRFLEIRRRVDHHHAHLFRGRLEAVRNVGGEEAGIAGHHLEFLAADLDLGGAFEQVGDLLDAGVRVRQRPLAALDLADQDFQVLGSKQAVVARPGMVRGRIRLYLRLANQVLDGGIQLCRAMPPSTRMEAPVT